MAGLPAGGGLPRGPRGAAGRTAAHARADLDAIFGRHRDADLPPQELTYVGTRRGAFYVGDRRFTVSARPAVPPGPGRGADRRRLHRHLRHRPAHPPRRDGPPGAPARGHRPRDVRPDRRDRRGRRPDWAVGDAGDGDAAGWCDACPACRAGHHAHLPPPRLHRHRLARAHAAVAGPSGRTSWCALPGDLPLRARRADRADRGGGARRATVAGLRAGEKAVVVGGGPVGLLIALVARTAGAEVAVVELDAHRRAVAAGLGLATVDPAATTSPRTSRSGPAVPARTWRSRCPAPRPASRTAVDVLAVRGRLVVVAIHPTLARSTCTGSSGASWSMIGVRVYERDRLRGGGRPVHDRRRAGGAASSPGSSRWREVSGGVRHASRAAATSRCSSTAGSDRDDTRST